MATKGQTITNTKTGEKITWMETAKDTDGKRLVFDFEVKPKGKLPVVHFHPYQQDTFTIKGGIFAIKLKKILSEVQRARKFLHKGFFDFFWIMKG
ncbi:hypothetical protein [Negadavirga shengliensis]|uniref:Uncharacterized protein n=1 Tax=Negadavirga shengliensis TaxID=1389218 RepID=A0ABV9SWL7_9BACT